MFIVGILSWWYGAGWRQRFTILHEQLSAMLDYFSIGLLARTLFSPFRQISAGQVDGSLEVKLRAFADRVISRLIGAFVRIAVMIAGILAIIVYTIVSAIALLIWACAPLLPLVGLTLFIVGWIPWKI
ncbi:MAG: hypothetical protein ABIQ04_03490 [Candidatus Saccharimonadales bacterium]